jgi:hypothetical protein
MEPASPHCCAPTDLTADVPAGQRPVRASSFLGGPSFDRLRTFQQWMAAVPIMKWEDFLDAHPRPHLVVAWLHATQRTGEGRVVSFDLLKRAATALDPRGDWALTDAKVGEIYIAYEEAADAAQLCTLVRAKPLGPSLQWMSQEAFRFQREARRSVANALKARARSTT